jgi:hypothetical protein
MICTCAFEGCTSLLHVHLPENILELSSSIFDGCKSLKQLNIPKSISKIDRFAFHDSGLECVHLSSALEEIGNHAFCNSPIKEYIVDSNNRSLLSINSVLYQKIKMGEKLSDGLHLIKYPQSKPDKEYIIENNTWWIGECAFKNAKNLEKIQIPKSINSILNSAFMNCTSLSEINYPANVSYVPVRGFYGCNTLSKINLASVRKICSEAFTGCTQLKELHLDCEDAYLMTVASNAFDDIIYSDCILYVPSGSRWSYRHHPIWGKFKNIIIENKEE